MAGGNADYALQFFRERGYAPHMAQGIVGNLLAESGLRPTGAVGDKGTAFGIAQWRGDRFANLQRFAQAQGKDWRSLDTQLGFVDHELRGPEKAALNRLLASTNVRQATAAFIGYERPKGWTANNPEAGHNFGGRLNFAVNAGGSAMPDGTDRLALAQAAGRQLSSIKELSAAARAPKPDRDGMVDGLGDGGGDMGIYRQAPAGAGGGDSGIYRDAPGGDAGSALLAGVQEGGKAPSFGDTFSDAAKSFAAAQGASPGVPGANATPSLMDAAKSQASAAVAASGAMDPFGGALGALGLGSAQPAQASADAQSRRAALLGAPLIQLPDSVRALLAPRQRMA